jgi:hypothetical protein
MIFDARGTESKSKSNPSSVVNPGIWFLPQPFADRPGFHQHAYRINRMSPVFVPIIQNTSNWLFYVADEQNLHLHVGGAAWLGLFWLTTG